MAVIVIDEDMHRSVADVLKALGHTPLDVRDHGLRSKSDQEVYEFAQEHKAAIITADLDFSSTVRFPLGAHGGIIITRFPNELSTKTINQALERSLNGLSDTDITGALIVISPGKIRIQRPPVS